MTHHRAHPAPEQLRLWAELVTMRSYWCRHMAEQEKHRGEDFTQPLLEEAKELDELAGWLEDQI